MSDPTPNHLAVLGRWLDELLDLTPAARAARLASLRADDPGLADTLERMLGTALDERTLEPGGALAGDLAQDCLLDRGEVHPPGTQLGAYRIQALIGRGGWADVYRASRSFDGFAQEVALKLVRAGRRTPLVARSVSEQQALARLSHPHIARFLDAGVIDGVPFLAMECVDGVPITHHADAVRASLRRRVRWMVELCDALAHAHSQLVIHCDLKPTNVFIDRRDGLRLLDFGIASIVEDAALPGEPAPRAFTPQYAAPEQVDGGGLTTATDVFQVGALLYVLLTGTPWVRDPAALLGGDWSELRRAEPEPPSERVRRLPREAARTHAHRCGLRDERALRRALAGDLDAVVLKCLARRPEDRYANVLKLADDLCAWLELRPVRVRRTPSWQRAMLWFRRNRVPVAATAAGLAVALAVGAIAFERVRTEREARERELARAAAVEGFLAEMFRQASPYAAQDRSTPLRTFVRVGDSLMAARTDLDPRTRARLDAALARLELQQGDAAAAGARARRALDLLGDAGADVALRVELADVLGNALAQQGRQAEAIALWERTLAEPSVARSSGSAFRIAAGLADLYRRSGEVAKAGATFASIEDHLFDAGQPHTSERVGALVMYATYLDQVGKGEAKIARIASILSAPPRDGASPAPALDARRRVSLSYLQLLQGKPMEAGDNAAQAARIFARTLGPSHPQAIKAHAYACTSYRDAGRLGLARAQCEAALRQAAPADGDDRRVLLLNLAGIELVAGRLVAAERHLADAADEPGAPGDAFQQLFAHAIAGRVHALRGRQREALAELERAERLRRAHFADNPEVAAHLAEHLVPLLVALGRDADARRVFEAGDASSMPAGLFRDRALAGRALLRAHLASAQGHADEVAREVRAAIDAHERLPATDANALLWTRIHGAELLIATGQCEQARAVLRPLYERREAHAELPAVVARVTLDYAACAPQRVPVDEVRRARETWMRLAGAAHSPMR